VPPPATSAAAGRPAKAWYLQLWAQVLIAMLIGILLGYFDPPLGERMAPLGDAFIKAIRMLIVPIIFCTVVHGIARMADMARVGRVAIKAIVYFEVLTTIALVIGLVAANLWQPGAGMNVDLSHFDTSALDAYVAQTQKQDAASFLINIIPNTFIGAFAEGNVLQVLFLSVLCGFAMTWIGPRAQPLLDIIEIATSMLFRVVAMVMWAAPLGAFGAIAFTVGKFGAGSLLSLGKLLGGFYVTCLVFVFCVLGPIAH
jgi:aerobic C4-dicarboxylate transport protein